MTRVGKASPDSQPTCHRPHRTGRTTSLALAVVLLAVLPGCQFRLGGESTTARENYRLASENQALQRQVAALEDRLELRLGELENLRQQLAAEGDAPALEGVEPPTLARLRFGRHSGAVDTDGDDRDDLIRIYLRPQDQRGRLLPVAGRAAVRAVTIPDDGEPQTLAERVYEPADFDRAWRDAFTGTHYTLELPLPDGLPDGETEVTVRVIFLDATTGTRLTHQQPVTIRR